MDGAGIFHKILRLDDSRLAGIFAQEVLGKPGRVLRLAGPPGEQVDPAGRFLDYLKDRGSNPRGAANVCFNNFARLITLSPKVKSEVRSESKPR